MAQNAEISQEAERNRTSGRKEPTDRIISGDARRESGGRNNRNVVFRSPVPADALPVWEMVRDSDGLDTNSLYYYRLWFRDFAETSLVAESEGEVVGFLSGYRRPEEPDVYLVWQEAVRPRHGIPGLGVTLFDRAVERQIQRGARYMETTVSLDNRAILMVINRFAKVRGLTVEKSLLFPAGCFTDGHHDETLCRVGPLS